MLAEAKAFLYLSAIAAGAVLGLAGACTSTQDNPQPSGVIPIYSSPAKDAQGGVSTNPSTSAGQAPSMSPDGGPPRDGPRVTRDESLEVVDAGIADAEPCEWDGSCYPCTPVTTEQRLNACTDAQTASFDNDALPLLDDGALPPLP